MANRECSDCAKPISRRSKTGRCLKCACRLIGQARKLPPRHCCDCGTEISRSAKGRCRPCGAAYVNGSAEIKARRADAIRAKFRDPNHAAKMRVVARENGKKASQDPLHRQWLKANGKRLYRDILSRPDIREKNIAAIRANSHKITEHFLGWCPPEWRDEYRYLIRTKRMLAAEAKAVILAQITAERERARRAAVREAEKLSPFERDELALKNGAKIVANDRAPQFGEARDYGENKWKACG